MSATKPTVFPDWATDHTIETTPGDPDAPNAIVEPSAEKIGEGWIWKEKPPFNFFNWLGRLTGDWIRFFESYAREHAHDGGADPLSAPKIDLTDHIEYGDNGGLAVDADTSVVHSIDHSHATTGFAILSSDILIAKLSQLTWGTVSDSVKAFRPGAAGNILRFRTHAEADTITLDVHTTQSTIFKAQGAGGVTIQDSAGAEGPITALNVARGWAVVDGPGEALLASAGAMVGATVARKGGAGTGRWEITLATPVPNATRVALHLTPYTAIRKITARMISTSIIELEVTDSTGSYADSNFSIVIYYY